MTDSASPDRPFRVIIAGAGVAGIAISHAFCLAGIDHIVLEKGDVAPGWGASISLWGHGSRILSQLGVLDSLEANALPLKFLHARQQNGKAFSEEAFFDMMKERNGFEAITMERKEYLDIVYRCHPDKSKIVTGKRVVDMEEGDNQVTVKLDDGTTETGDLLLGADGVHSKVRELMWHQANSHIPGFIDVEEKQSLVTTYRSIVGVSKTVPGLGIRDMHWVSHVGLSFLILTQPEKTFFFVNWKMPRQIRWPTKAKWTAEEAEEAAKSVIDLPISDSVTFGELWKNKYRANFIGLEEGIFKHWSFGRTALVGDSVHKVTPNFALGANCALESSVVLVNGIVALNNEFKRTGVRPSQDQISQMLQKYQETRLDRMKRASAASALITRLQAFDGPLNHFIMRWIFPVAGQATYADQLADLCAGAPKFDFLPVDYKLPATFKWEDENESWMAQDHQKEPRRQVVSQIGLEFAAVIVAMMLVLWVLQVS